MKFARINLSKTDYTELDIKWLILTGPEVQQKFKTFNDIYSTYCRHKKFKSVRPFFISEYVTDNAEVIAYYIKNKIVAYSLIIILDNENVECEQFAWDYADPELTLGLRSIEHECAVYKSRGYKYLYLGYDDYYKQKFNGFETLGPILF
jgi:hypothetical protein